MIVKGAAIPTHDFPMAAFKFVFTEEASSLSVSFDKTDIDSVLSLDEQTLAKKDRIKEYFLAHFKLVVNEEETLLHFERFEEVGDHYQLHFSFPQSRLDIVTLKVRNTCLVEEIEDQTNVMYFEYDDNTRGFRMHKGRQEIEVTL